MTVFETFCFIFNAFHCAFLVFYFQLSKTQIFLLILNLRFAANFEAKSFLTMVSGLLHVLMV